MSLDVDVLVASRLSEDDVAALSRDFATAGLRAHLREVPPRRSFGDTAWYVMAAIPFAPFFEEMAKKAAEDGYSALRELVGKVGRRARAETQGRTHQVFVLQDATTGARIVLEPDLPAHAYEQLLAYDLSSVRRGPLHYDRYSSRWRSELDEAGL